MTYLYTANLSKNINYSYLLRKHKLIVKAVKCNVGVSSVDFLGFKISTEGNHTQGRVVDAVSDWPTPKSISEVRHFIGLTDVYRTFVKNFAEIAQPVTDLLRDKKFTWE